MYSSWRRRVDYFHYFGSISQKHLDFLLCDAQTMKPLCGIELDDFSHANDDRQERDHFVDTLFRDAALPLLRVRVQREYDTREIAALVAPFLEAPEKPAPDPQAAEAPTLVDSVPICPRCGVPMVLRMAARGDHRGRQFYGCINFPNCREMKSIPDARSVVAAA